MVTPAVAAMVAAQLCHQTLPRWCPKECDSWSVKDPSRSTPWGPNRCGFGKGSPLTATGMHKASVLDKACSRDLGNTSILIGKASKSALPPASAGRRADFEAFPTGIRPKSGPEA